MARTFDPIVKTHGVCGGRARIEGTRIPVWAVVKARRDGLSIPALERHFVRDLNRLEIGAAIEYARANRKEIEADIRANEAMP